MGGAIYAHNPYSIELYCYIRNLSGQIIGRIIYIYCRKHKFIAPIWLVATWNMVLLVVARTSCALHSYSKLNLE